MPTLSTPLEGFTFSGTPAELASIYQAIANGPEGRAFHPTQEGRAFSLTQEGNEETSSALAAKMQLTKFKEKHIAPAAQMQLKSTMKELQVAPAAQMQLKCAEEEPPAPAAQMQLESAREEFQLARAAQMQLKRVGEEHESADDGGINTPPPEVTNFYKAEIVNDPAAQKQLAPVALKQLKEAKDTKCCASDCSLQAGGATTFYIGDDDESCEEGAPSKEGSTLSQHEQTEGNTLSLSLLVSD